MNRLRERYVKEIVPNMQKKFNYKSVMQVPKLDKIVINIGCGDATHNSKLLDAACNDLLQITGQKPVVTKAKKSIAGFKIREGQAIGCKVTLRGERMYNFLDKLISVSLPRVRDFRGLSPKAYDGRGNYTIGIKEQLVFPEIEFDDVVKVRGMDIVLVTTANTNEEAFDLLKELGVPFVMAKAMNSLHGRILEKIGADKVIYPEHSMGIRVARNLLSSGFVDMFELSSDFSMAEFKIPREWIGKTLRELKVREKYNINLIGLKHGDKMNMNVAPDEVFPADCTVVAAGANSDLNKVSEN